MTTYNPTGAEQIYTVPETGDYSIVLRGGRGGTGGGMTTGTIFLEVGTPVVFKVGGNGTMPADNSPGVGGWPDGGPGGQSGGWYSGGGGGSTSMFIGGALVAIAGGSGQGVYSYGGGVSGTNARSFGGEGGRQYAGGNGGAQIVGHTSNAGGNGSYMQGGSGSNCLTTEYTSAGGGGGLYGGGGGAQARYGSPINGGGGGGSGWTGALVSGSTYENINTGNGYATITYVGPNPSGTMPGIPLTIRVRASTDTCQVEKDITVRVLGYVVHATFAIPSLVVGTPVSYQLPLNPGTGYAPIVWTTSGTLPTGLTLSAAGVLSGTPSAADTFNWSATATDDSGAAATTAVESVVAAS